MTINSADVISIIAGARKVPVTVVDMADYRRTHSGAPHLIVKTLADLIRRAHGQAPMSREQRESVDAAADLVNRFGPIAGDPAQRFGRTLMHCFNLIDRCKGLDDLAQVEVDEELERECAWLLGCSA